MENIIYDSYKKLTYDIQTKINENQQTNDYIIDVNDPNITKHKGRSPKMLQSNVEKSSSKSKHVLGNSADQCL